MCLDVVKRPAEAKRVTRNMDIKKDKYVKLWKVFCIDENDCLVAQFKKYQFYEGKNTARGEAITNMHGDKIYSREQYTPGFHSFTSKKDAERWINISNDFSGLKREIYPVRIKKAWVTNIGVQNGKVVVVSKHIVI